MNYAAQTTDPATFEIVKNSLYKIAEEMRVVLAKTAYSPLLKSAGDYSCGVFDARGEMVAQGPDLPIHLGSMPDAVRAVVAAFAGDVHEGDVFIHNDPYFGGSHLPDVNVVRPAFYAGQLLGYACLRAHWPDVGSATPGTHSTSVSTCVCARSTARSSGRLDSTCWKNSCAACPESPSTSSRPTRSSCASVMGIRSAARRM